MANLDINKSLGLKKYHLTKIDLPFLFLLKNGTRMIWAERQNSYDPPSGWLCTVGNKWGFRPLSTAFWRRRERGCQKPRLLARPNQCLSWIKTVTKTHGQSDVVCRESRKTYAWTDAIHLGSVQPMFDGSLESWLLSIVLPLYVLTHTHTQSLTAKHTRRMCMENQSLSPHGTTIFKPVTNSQ